MERWNAPCMYESLMHYITKSMLTRLSHGHHATRDSELLALLGIRTAKKNQ